MTLGDIIEKIRTLFGGKTKDERNLEELRFKIAKISDECAQLRKRNEAIQKEIDDKTAQYRAETIDANKIMLLKEIKTLKTDFDRIQGTFDEKDKTKVTLMALRTELERQISDKTNNISVDTIEDATEIRKDREKGMAEVSSALDGLEGKKGGKGKKGSAKTAKDELADLEAEIFGTAKSAPAPKTRTVKTAPTEAPGVTSEATEAPAPVVSASV